MKEKSIGLLLFLLIVLQPVLDVLSYFMIQQGSTGFTTLLRFLIFAVVMLYAFWIAENKKAYYFFAGVVGVYWILHMINCFRIGYRSPLDDFSNFLRVVQMPAFVLAFITLYRKCPNYAQILPFGFFVNILTIWFVILLSYCTGNPVYTYPGIKSGLMGWFGVPNAQSAIVVLLVPLALYFAYYNKKILFLLTAALGFSLLFFTGTKLTFYSLILIAGGFLFLILINVFFVSDRKKYWKSNWFAILILCTAAVLPILFIPYSPMHQRETKQDTAYSNHQEDLSEILGESSSNGSGLPSTDNISEPLSMEQYEKLYRSISGGFLGDLIDCFGIERVAEKYGYSTEASQLLGARNKKLNFAQLAWEDQDFLTKCFGYEYKTLITENENYDLENDFPSILYFYGYTGFGLYILFLLYFFYLIFRELIIDIQKLFSFQSGLTCITLLLLLGAAQFSGNVLRRPNVSIYLSMILALLYMMYHIPKIRKKGQADDADS